MDFAAPSATAEEIQDVADRIENTIIEIIDDKASEELDDLREETMVSEEEVMPEAPMAPMMEEGPEEPEADEEPEEEEEEEEEEGEGFEAEEAGAPY